MTVEPARHGGAGLAPVTGLGDPVLDIVCNVSFDLLKALHAEAGGCITVEPDEMERLLALPAVQQGSLRLPGGSAANVVKGLAGLAGGERPTAFVGMIGGDPAGGEYRRMLESQRVSSRFLLESSSGAATASCLCLVTPDGQRTMRTCLSAAMELNSPSLLPHGLLPPRGLLHCEGYCLYRADVAEAAMRAARAVQGAVSLDLASFEVVRGCFPALLRLLGAGLVDLVFCNEQEAEALCQEAGLEISGGRGEGAIHAAQAYLLRYCSVAVCSRGAKGCVAASREGGRARSAAASCQVVDTVGAGDYFTAGFLHAWLQGGALEVCAACGCAAGTAAVQVAGATLGGEALRGLRQRVEGLMGGEGGLRVEADVEWKLTWGLGGGS